MTYLGLLPQGLDLLALYVDLLEEQMAGMYDIDTRVLLLADWVPLQLQSMVATHEVAHALQDQHFSLRVRKRLGFETPDAEAAWQTLVEGDASAVMLDASLQPLGESFTALVDSTLGREGGFGALLDTALSAGVATDMERIQSAPRAVREALMFPYEYGLGFVAALHTAGGWKRVDEAYLHPPVSTEQVMHPQQFLAVRDAPVRDDLPDVRGLLEQDSAPVVTLSMGEFDLYLYLSEYVDAEIAKIASTGWAGATATLYAEPKGGHETFVFYSTWDTEEDATEFFGALLGVMEKRFPRQVGVPEITSEDQITWSVYAAAKYRNIVGLRGRDVYCIEGTPTATLTRVVQKLEQQVRARDPTPELRALQRDQLPWNRSAVAAADADSGMSLRVVLPPGWVEEKTTAAAGILQVAHRAGGRLEVGADRTAMDRLGASGYAHALAERVQKRGTDVYAHTDVPYERPDGKKLYQHVFAQTEGGRQVVYYIGAAELEPGFGYVLISEPKDGVTPALDVDFYKILDTLEIVSPPAPPPATGGGDGHEH